MKTVLLISALKAQPDKLIEDMKVASDAVLINQCDVDREYEIKLEKGMVHVVESSQRGIGNSRNLALEKACGDIFLFSDDDISYVDNYDALISEEFERHPEADGIFFNFEVDPSRKTYEIEDFGPVTFRASGRYPTYSLAIKGKCVKEKSLSFSPLFGGGAKYSCGEDSLFIMDCLKAGLKLYKSPLYIGQENFRPSTWFNGYTEKFFFDKGVLYHFLYGKLSYMVGARFILKHHKLMCKNVAPFKAYKLILQGIKEGKQIKRTQS